MISRIRGSLISKNIPIIEILCSGLTYEILVSMETFNKLPDLGSDVDIFVYLLIKEDSHTLFGFHSYEEKSLFMKLIKLVVLEVELLLAYCQNLTQQNFTN